MRLELREDLLVEKVEVFLVEANLLRSVAASKDRNYVKRPIVFVNIQGEGVQGFGECASLEFPFYTSEYALGSFGVIRDMFLPDIAKKLRNRWNLEGIGSCLNKYVDHQMAKSAVEMAFIDAALKKKGQSLKTALGVAKDEVKPGAVIGRCGSIQETLDEVELATSQGYERVKLKIEPGYDTEVARQVRVSYPQTEIYLDANGSYETLSQALEAFTPMDDFGITLIEQPFSPDEIVLSTRLCGHIATPICLDESLTSPAMARTLIELGACDIVSAKVGRLGGITQVLKLHDYCEEMGVKGWIGGTFSSSLGRCVDIVCAGLEYFSLSSDIALPFRGLDISENDLLEIVDGNVRVPNNVGLGQEFSQDCFGSKIIAKHDVSLKV